MGEVSGNKSVYVSYAHADGSSIVDEFQEKLPNSIQLIRDINSTRPGDWISEFEKEIGRAKLVLVVL